ncbi:MAG TPA: hypothetical protein VIJ22_00975 [Polyangiaceae bacterium]
MMTHAAMAARTTPVAMTDPGAAASTTDASLLPDADSLSGGGIDDALGVLYMAMAQQSQSGMQAGEATVNVEEKAEQKALADQQAAIAKQQANQANHGRGFFSSIGHLLGDVTKDVTHLRPEALVKDTVGDVKDAVNSPAFWNDLEKGALVVAKVAAVVGSAVVTTASFGAGGATIAGAALLLSVGGEAVSDTKCFGTASGGIGAALEITGAAVGVGGSALEAVSTGLSAASKTALGIGVAVEAFGGGSEAVAGGAHIENQDFAATAQNAAADAQHAVSQNAELEQTVGWVIDDLKAADKAHKGAMQATQSAIQDSDQSMSAAAGDISVKG